MRYDLTDFEWSVIEPLLPMQAARVKPKKNRRVLNGIFWVLRTGAPWRDMPERYGPYTTAYNRFNRWRKAAICDRLMDAIVQGARRQRADDRQLDCARASACLRSRKKSGDRCVGRSRGGLTTKIHARVDAQGRPVRFLISPGDDHDVPRRAAARRHRAGCHCHCRQGLRRRSCARLIRDQAPFPTFRTAPTKSSFAGTRPSIASAITSSASSTSSSSSGASPRDTTSSRQLLRFRQARLRRICCDQLSSR